MVNDVNAGFAAACNQGASYGDSEFLLFLNPDAILDEENLNALIHLMKERPEIGVASPTIRYPDGSHQRVRWPYPSAAGAWMDVLGFHRQRQSRPERSDCFVIGACFLVRRSIFQQVGGFDTRYWLYGEEADLCWRISKAGGKIVEVDDCVAVHVGGTSSEPADPFILEHFFRGGERFVSDHGGKLSLLSFRLATIFSSAVRATIPGPELRMRSHRARLRRSIIQLTKAPFAVPIDSPSTTARGNSIVVCSLEAWDDVWRRNQLLASSLLDADPQLRILFVEPAFDHIHRLLFGRTTDRKRKLRSARGDGRVIVLEPAKMLPRLFGDFADRSLCRQVQASVKQLGFDQPTLWVNDASYARLAQKSDWPSLYDITDDWLRLSQSGRARRRLKENEGWLLDHAGAVVVCSNDLVKSRRHIRPDVDLIPNAVDLEHFTALRVRPADLPKAPVALYMGTLHEERLDIDLLLDLAEAIPTLEIVLVGPSSLGVESIGKLRAHPNITLLGQRPYSDVPAYLQHAGRPDRASYRVLPLPKALTRSRPTSASPWVLQRSQPQSPDSETYRTQ